MIDNIGNNNFIRKSFNSYLIPSILSILGGNISIMIDNCVAGAVLGEQALAAMSIVNPVFNVITAFGLLICGGASTLASIHIGRFDTTKKHMYFTLSFYLLLLVGGVLTAVGLLALNPIITALGGGGELFVLAKDYCRVMLGGSIALMIIYFPLNFFRIEGRAKMGMLMFFLMSFLDIVFDLLFVVWFDFGMAGLSFATILSAAIAAAVVFPFLFTKQLGYRFVRLHHPLADMAKMLRTGSPMALGNLYTVVRVRVINGLLLSYGGTLALAAYNCANNVNIIGMALVTGIAQTVGPIVGVLYGECDSEGIKNTAKRAVVTGGLSTVVFGLLAAVFSGPLARLFGMTSPQQLEAARTAIVILSANLLFVMLSSVLIYCYMTCGHAALANLVVLAKGLALALPFAFLSAMLWGTTGILVGLVLAEAGTVLLAVAMAAYIRRKKPDYEGILLLSHNIFKKDHCLTCNALNCDENISAAAQQGTDFCETHGLTAKQAMTVGLAVEEIMVLMSKYALPSQTETIEFRLFISAEKTVLYLRCGGKWFNPLAFEPEDELDNMGVKMLLKMSSDFSYSTNLGMNNIRITI